MLIIEEIVRLDFFSDPDLQQAKDFGLFSFLAYGMLFVDLVHLTRENIVDGEQVYNRSKTGTSPRTTS